MRKIDLTGQRFGRLTVTREAAKLPGNNNRRWECQCDCGKKIVAFGSNLRTEHTTSCGCALSDFTIKKNTTHGKKYHRLYRIWCHMKERCNKPDSKFYKDYGGRGIKVCSEWEHDFMAFYTWAITNGYADNLSIDRKDNDKGYDPSNCQWTTQKVQGNNTRQNVYYTVNGETRTQREWEEIIGVRRGRLWKIKNARKSVVDFIMQRLEEQT